MDCGACHLGSEDITPAERAKFGLQVTRVSNGQSYDLFANGYEPGEQYKIEVRLQNEKRGRMGSPNVPPAIGDVGILPFSATTSPWKAACVPMQGMATPAPEAAAASMGRITVAGDSTRQM